MLVASFTGLVRRHELIWVLTLDALRKQFAGAVLGLWWAILKPLLLLGLYAFLFMVIFRPTLGSAVDERQYPLLMLSGLVPWLLLAEPLAAASGAIAANTPLLTKVAFPMEVLPVSRVLSGAASGSVGLLLLIVVLAYQGHLGFWAMAVPLLLVLQLVFVMGLAWITAAVCVTVPDFSQGLPFLLNVWMLLSPVVYSPEMVPANWAWIVAVNPMSHAITLYRTLLLNNSAPETVQVLILTACSLASFWGGFLIFMKRRALFADAV